MNNNLARVLNTMSERDQKMRKCAIKTGIWDKRIDKENTKRLKRIIEQYGWPTIDLVGKKASRNAWLITQHADHDIEFQKKILNLLEKIYNHDPLGIDKRNIAFLKDRVFVNEGKRQIFGTQFFIKKNGGLDLRPIRNIKNIDKLRSDYALPPLRVYLNLVKSHRSTDLKKRTRSMPLSKTHDAPSVA